MFKASKEVGEESCVRFWPATPCTAYAFFRREDETWGWAMEPGQAGLQTRRVRLALPRDAAGGSNMGRRCLALPSQLQTPRA